MIGLALFVACGGGGAPPSPTVPSVELPGAEQIIMRAHRPFIELARAPDGACKTSPDEALKAGIDAALAPPNDQERLSVAIDRRCTWSEVGVFLTAVERVLDTPEPASEPVEVLPGTSVAALVRSPRENVQAEVSFAWGLPPTDDAERLDGPVSTEAEPFYALVKALRPKPTKRVDVQLLPTATWSEVVDTIDMAKAAGAQPVVVVLPKQRQPSVQTP